MKRITLFCIVLLSVFTLTAQTTLTFTGRDASNHFLPLNRVVISNLTKSWSETITYPDTVLVMSTVGIDDYDGAKEFQLSQNIPNPFDGSSDFSLCIPQGGNVFIEVNDLNGKRITAYQNHLPAGCHIFRVLLSTAQSFVLTARCGNDQSTIKIVNKGSAGVDELHYLGEGKITPLEVLLKSGAKGETEHPFAIGDLMEYVGYAIVDGEEYESQRIQQQQGSSQNFILNFDCIANPEIALHNLSVSNITAFTASLSANVTSNTDGQGVSRGFQFDTDASFSDMVTIACATGNGDFSANVTGLQDTTTYYVRAYATYHNNTVYSNVETFTTVCNPPTIAVSGNNVICVGESTTLTASGTDSYVWSPATGLGSITGASVVATPSVSTIYHIIGTLANGCSNSIDYVVTVNPTFNTDVTADICPGDSYDFFGQHLTVAGTYTHTLQSIQGCDSVITLSLTYRQVPTVSVSGNTTICLGTSTTLTAQGAVQYVWSPATGLNSTTGNVVTATPASTSSYTVTGTAANGCSNYASVLVTVLPTTSTTINASICQGQQYSFFGQPLALSGTYTHTLQGANGCDSVITLQLTVNSLPAISVSGNTSICAGGYTLLTAIGASSYQWIPATGLNTGVGANVVATPNNSVTYTIVGTDLNGCTNTGTASVTVNPVFNTNISADICQGESYDFFGQALTTSGTYTQTLQTVNGCDSVITLALTVKQLPNVSIVGNTEVCQGDNTILAANGAISYTWSPATGLNTTSGNIVTATPAVSTLYSVTGTAANGCTHSSSILVNVYETHSTTFSDNVCQGAVYDFFGQQLTTGGVYSHTLQNVHGCDSVITLVLSVKNSPTVSITGVRSICEGGSTVLTANGASSYAWAPATSLNTASGAVVVATPSSTTSYTVTGTAANGCSGTATAEVVVHQNYQTNISATICPGQTYDFYGQALTAAGSYTHILQSVDGCDSVINLSLVVPSLTLSGNTVVCNGESTTLTATGAYNCQWTPSTGLNTAFGNTVIVTPAATTHYTVTGTGAANCALSAEVDVSVFPSYSRNVSASICQGASYDFYGQSLTASGTYSHTLQTVHGCDSVIILQLTVNQLPNISISGNNSICSGGNTTLTASGASSYQWSPATGLNTTAGSVVTAAPTTTVAYLVVGTDANGCTNSATRTVTVYDNPSLSINGTTTVNYGSSTSLTAIGASTYHWSTGASNATISVSPLQTTAYSVTGTNTHGCTATASATVTVIPVAPTVSTLAVTNVSDSSAVLHAELQSNGGTAQVTCGFQYSTSNTFATCQTSNATASAFYKTITGLDMATTYYVRAYATNSVGTAYGSVVSFTTLSCSLPAVVTNAVDTNLRTKTTVTVSGSLSNNGGCQIINKGFCWSTSTYPSINDNVMMLDPNSSEFTAVLTNLQSLTTYYLRAFAINHAGVAYGNRVQFQTMSANLADLTTTAISNIEAYSATSGGRVLSAGHPVTARGVCWSTSPAPTVNDSHTTNGSGVGSFTSSLTGLTDGVTYYVRAYATIDEGTSYGNEFSFTTLSLPVLTTGVPDNVTSNSVTLGGNISNQGASTVTERGVCYGITANPTITGNHKSVGDGTGSFSCSVSGLSAGTTYYVRAYATNDRGTAYGEQKSFTTGNFTCGTSTFSDYDGNSYQTVQMGNRCWMKENLRATHYSDGTSIALGSDTSSTTAYRYYPNDDNLIVGTYGYLYNWAAVMHGAITDNANPSTVQGICPTGWHVPSNAEWNEMTTYVSNQLNYLCNETSANIAKALASTTGWESSTNLCAVGNNPSGNNATGFGAMPAGAYNGTFSHFGTFSEFWSSTQSNITDANCRNLSHSTSTVDNANYNKIHGYSVRCVRDVTGLPSIRTVEVTIINGHSATSSSVVESQGNSAITARGVCWSTSQNPTISDSHTSDGTGMGSFASAITELLPGNTYYVRSYAVNSYGISYGNAISTSTPSCGSPTVTDYDGNSYQTVLIGQQCWMKQNLKTTHYADGTSIALGSSTSTTTAYRYYPSNSSGYVSTYGYLYNWKAVMRNSSSSSGNPSGVQGICPTGWHVPSDAEWTQLTDYVGSQSAYQCNGSSSYIAKALASTTGWSSSAYTCAVGNNLGGNNATGFSAVPAGCYDGSYYHFGYGASFWSATRYDSSDAYYRKLYYNDAYVDRGSNYKNRGFSVRCLRD